MRIQMMACVLLIASCTIGCDVDQTREAEMPEVEVQGGQLDVDTADVDVSRKPETITVPDVDVDTEQREVIVPEVDITMPDEGRDDPEEPQR